MHQVEVFRVPTTVLDHYHVESVGIADQTTSAPAAPWSLNPRSQNMSQINEFLGQSRNDSLCAAVEFWRGSLNQVET